MLWRSMSVSYAKTLHYLWMYLVTCNVCIHIALIHIHFVMNSSQFQLNFILDHLFSAIFEIFPLFSVLCFRAVSFLIADSRSEVCSVHCNGLCTETNSAQIVCLEQLPLGFFFVSNLRAGSKAKSQTTSTPPNSLKLLAATRTHLVRVWYVVCACVHFCQNSKSECKLYKLCVSSAAQISSFGTKPSSMRFFL